MLTWDLSDTKLARTNELVHPPHEAELNLLLTAMLLTEGIPYSELTRHALVLTEENREQVAQVIEWCLSPLAGDIGAGEHLRRRLSELEGLAVTCLPVTA